LRHDSLPPGRFPSNFSENLQSAPPPHWRWQHRSRGSPWPSSSRLHPQFQAPLPPVPLGFRFSFVSPSLASVICTVSTVHLALRSTTAISVSLMPIYPDRKSKYCTFDAHCKLGVIRVPLGGCPPEIGLCLEAFRANWKDGTQPRFVTVVDSVSSSLQSVNDIESQESAATE
jgi:hypothetical protein